MRSFLTLTILVFIMISCTEDRYYEANHDFTDRTWDLEETAEFNFSVDSTDIPYQISINLRNSLSYPYRNIYIQYTLKDSLRTINQKLLNLQLFDSKAGKPYGDAQSEIYSHQLLAEDSVYFPQTGNYTIELKQYMRENELEGVISAGIRLDR